MKGNPIGSREIRRRNLLPRSKISSLNPISVTITAEVNFLAPVNSRDADSRASQALSQAVRNAHGLGDEFELWQSSCGTADPVKCPYWAPNSNLQEYAPATRALYRLYDSTGNDQYKAGADR